MSVTDGTATPNPLPYDVLDWYTLTMPGESRGTGAAPGPTADPYELACDWARAVTQAVYRPLSRSEAEALFAGLLGDLRQTLLATPFSADAARSVGARLAAEGVRKPQALERSLIFLDEHLLAALDLDDYTYRPMMTRLLAGLAAGWAGVVREQALRDAREQRRSTVRRQDADPSRTARQRGA